MLLRFFLTVEECVGKSAFVVVKDSALTVTVKKCFSSDSVFSRESLMAPL